MSLKEIESNPNLSAFLVAGKLDRTALGADRSGKYPSRAVLWPRFHCRYLHRRDLRRHRRHHRTLLRILRFNITEKKVSYHKIK